MPRRLLGMAIAASAVILTACGGEGEVSAGEVERRVAERAQAAGEIRAVRCRRAQLAWGCELTLAGGETQACQAGTEGGEVTAVVCQPLRSE